MQHVSASRFKPGDYIYPDHTGRRAHLAETTATIAHTGTTAILTARTGERTWRRLLPSLLTHAAHVSSEPLRHTTTVLAECAALVPWWWQGPLRLHPVWWWCCRWLCVVVCLWMAGSER